MAGVFGSADDMGMDAEDVEDISIMWVWRTTGNVEEVKSNGKGEIDQSARWLIIRKGY